MGCKVGKNVSRVSLECRISKGIQGWRDYVIFAALSSLQEQEKTEAVESNNLAGMAVTEEAPQIRVVAPVPEKPPAQKLGLTKAHVVDGL